MHRGRKGHREVGCIECVSSKDQLCRSKSASSCRRRAPSRAVGAPPFLKASAVARTSLCRSRGLGGRSFSFGSVEALRIAR